MNRSYMAAPPSSGSSASDGQFLGRGSVPPAPSGAKMRTEAIAPETQGKGQFSAWEKANEEAGEGRDRGRRQAFLCDVGKGRKSARHIFHDRREANCCRGHDRQATGRW